MTSYEFIWVPNYENGSSEATLCSLPCNIYNFVRAAKGMRCMWIASEEEFFRGRTSQRIHLSESAGRMAMLRIVLNTIITVKRTCKRLVRLCYLTLWCSGRDCSRWFGGCMKCKTAEHQLWFQFGWMDSSQRGSVKNYDALDTNWILTQWRPTSVFFYLKWTQESSLRVFCRNSALCMRASLTLWESQFACGIQDDEEEDEEVEKEERERCRLAGCSGEVFLWWLAEAANHKV